MLRRAAALALILALAAAGAPAAQTPLQSEALVEELVVRAYGGPAWWTVSNGESKVYVLAVIDETPAALPWNRTLLERRLTGAKRLIMPVEFRNPRTAANAIKYRQFIGQVKRGMHGDELSPALARRFTLARQAIGLPEERYEGLPPGAAAMLLAGDYRELWDRQAARGPTQNVIRTIAATGRARRVAIQQPQYSGPALNAAELIADLQRPGEACAAAILADLEKGFPAQRSPAYFARSARAWAEGDIRPLLEWLSQGPTMGLRLKGYHFWLPPGAWRACTAQMTSSATQATERTAVRDATAAIARELRTPGHAVALVYPWALLSRNGVLDELRRQGFEVTTPAAQNAD